MNRTRIQALGGVIVRWSLVALLAAAIMWVEAIKRQLYQAPRPSAAHIAHRQRWHEHHISSYDLSLRLTTPTDPIQGGDLDIVIRHDQVISRTCRPAHMTCRIYHTPGWQVDGVPTLFYLAQYGFQEAAGTTPGCLDVAYDPEYGYPRRIDTTRCAIPTLKLIPVQLEVVRLQPVMEGQPAEGG